MAFTGQILRWDQDAYWGLGIGAAIAGQAPLIGPQDGGIAPGGPIIAGPNCRAFCAACLCDPRGADWLVALHLWLVLRLGINEWPVPGRLVDRASSPTLRSRSAARRRAIFPSCGPERHGWDGPGRRWRPRLRRALRPPWSPRRAGSTLINTAPRPDFYFLALYALFALLPPWTETVCHPRWPRRGHCVAARLAVPGRHRRKSWRLGHRGGERPAGVLTVVTLAGLGITAHWSPEMEAWSALPT